MKKHKNYLKTFSNVLEYVLTKFLFEKYWNMCSECLITYLFKYVFQMRNKSVLYMTAGYVVVRSRPFRFWYLFGKQDEKKFKKTNLMVWKF